MEGIISLILLAHFVQSQHFKEFHNKTLSPVVLYVMYCIPYHLKFYSRTQRSATN